MKTILITGSSSGIGKATAKHFAENGWNVVATMRSPEKETELTLTENVLVTKLDVEQNATIQDAVKKGIERFGKIHVLLNNAGYGTLGIFESASDEQIQRQFDVNVFGLMRMIKTIMPHFRANKNGLIINISSMGGRLTIPTMSLYHATKFAVEGFTEALSYELAAQNVRVKLIEPGMVKTNFSGSSMDILYDETLTDYQEYFGRINTSIRDISNNDTETSPDSVADVIYQAANDDTNQLRYIVGEDAEALLKLRTDLPDESFTKYITGMFS